MITQDLSVASKHSRVFGAGTSAPSLHSARTYLDRESSLHLPPSPTVTGPRRDFLESASALSLRPRILFPNDKKCRLFELPSNAPPTLQLVLSPEAAAYHNNAPDPAERPSTCESYSRSACNADALAKAR